MLFCLHFIHLLWFKSPHCQIDESHCENPQQGAGTTDFKRCLLSHHLLIHSRLKRLQRPLPRPNCVRRADRCTISHLHHAPKHEWDVPLKQMFGHQRATSSERGNSMGWTTRNKRIVGHAPGCNERNGIKDAPPTNSICYRRRTFPATADVLFPIKPLL